MAIVAFGGAYAVPAYMAQEAAQGFGWLQPGEMADGLGLAETTPGPLIVVTQFVGYLATYRSPEPFIPMVAGLLGAVAEEQSRVLRFYTPEWTSFEWRAALLAAIACLLVFAAKWSVVRVLGVAAAGGLILGLAV